MLSPAPCARLVLALGAGHHPGVGNQTVNVGSELAQHHAIGFGRCLHLEQVLQDVTDCHFYGQLLSVHRFSSSCGGIVPIASLLLVAPFECRVINRFQLGSAVL